MLNPNAKIEQFIYTACGRDNSGAFSIWSKSKGIDQEVLDLYENRGDYSSSICSLSSLINRDPNGKDRTGTPNSEHYKKQVSTGTRLKAGAKPHGLFKKYNDDDYEEYEVVRRNEIIILDQSTSEDIEELMEEKRKNGKKEDYRENPQDAPYRVIATKLHDGRLFVMRRTMIGRVYSDMDLRTGNYCDSVLVFPAGTEIKDLDVKNLPFTKGLASKNHKSELFPNRPYEPAPEFLPTFTAQDLYKQSSSSNNQQKPQTQTKSQTTSARQDVKIDKNYENIIQQALRYQEYSNKLKLLRAEPNPDDLTIYDMKDYSARISSISKNLDEMIGRLDDEQLSELNDACEELKAQARKEKLQGKANGFSMIHMRCSKEIAKRKEYEQE